MNYQIPTELIEALITLLDSRQYYTFDAGDGYTEENNDYEVIDVLEKLRDIQRDPLDLGYVWHPISTAPKDREILVWNGARTVSAKWNSAPDGDYNNPGWSPTFVGCLWQDDVTHWMPTPKKPD